MKQVQKGFTLIELMIVIAIVGILAAVALPAYQDYTVRAKMSEALAKSAEAKTTIAEFFVARGALPADMDEAGLVKTVNTKNVKSVEWTSTGGSGLLTVAVTALGGDVADGETFVLSLSDSANGVLQWRCKAGTVEPKYLPASCR